MRRTKARYSMPKQLEAAVKDMYVADKLMTELAEAAVNEDAADS